MTSLDIGRLVAEKQAPATNAPRCPKCGGTKRETAQGFGARTPRVLCAECAYEIQETTR